MLTFDYELALINDGYTHICGVDEAGRGPLAGPVVAAACILPPDCVIDGLDDSKSCLKRNGKSFLIKYARTPFPTVSLRPLLKKLIG